MSDSTPPPPPNETTMLDSPPQPDAVDDRPKKAVFFEFPREIRNMIYASLICLSRPKECLLPFSTCSKDVRHTLGTSYIPAARQFCRQFDDELHEVLHGPRFPKSLHLNICFHWSNEWISGELADIDEITGWEEEVSFEGVPKRYLERVEMAEVEWVSDPHFTWDEIHQLWVELFKGAISLKEIKLRIELELVSGLDYLEEILPHFLEHWDALKRVECVHKWGHGISALIKSRPGKEERMTRLVFEKKGLAWDIVKEFGRV